MADPLAIAGLGLGVLSGIFSGLQGNAAARRQQQAYVQAEMQKGINNGKELFNAVYRQQQVQEKNAAIIKAAYLYESDSLESAQKQFNFAQTQLSNNYKQYRGALQTQMANNMISGGTKKALSLMQNVGFLKQTLQTEENLKQAEKNIKRQKENMLSQQRLDVIIPNTQLPSVTAPAGPSLLTFGAGLASGTATGLGLYAQLQGPAGLDIEPSGSYNLPDTFIGRRT